MISTISGGGLPFMFRLALRPNVYPLRGAKGLDTHVGGPYLLY